MTSFQAVLRGRPGDAASWEGLGSAYEALGRLTAGLKVGCLLQHSMGLLVRTASFSNKPSTRLHSGPLMNRCSVCCALFKNFVARTIRGMCLTTQMDWVAIRAASCG